MEITFDIEKLQNYLKSFYVLTNIRIVVFDINRKVIASYPEKDCGFCEFIQNNKSLCEKCKNSNNISFNNCHKTNKLVMYKCHMNLIEATAPLINGNVTVGYLMIGQLSDIKDKKERCEKLFGKFDFLNSNKEDVEKLLMNVKYKSEEQIHAAATILNALANNLILENTIKVKNNLFKQNIDNYIDDNLNNKINTRDLCDFLSIGRTKLFDMSNKYLGMPIASYVNSYKINIAKKRLKNGKKIIKEVCLELGYCDANYFTKMFKKYVGITPNEYIKQYNVK